MAVAVTPEPPSTPNDDRPRPIVVSVAAGDRIFRGAMRAAGIHVADSPAALGSTMVEVLKE